MAPVTDKHRGRNFFSPLASGGVYLSADSQLRLEYVVAAALSEIKSKNVIPRLPQPQLLYN